MVVPQLLHVKERKMKGEMKREVKSVKWELYEKEIKDKKADSSFFGTLDSF